MVIQQVFLTIIENTIILPNGREFLIFSEWDYVGRFLNYTFDEITQEQDEHLGKVGKA